MTATSHVVSVALERVTNDSLVPLTAELALGELHCVRVQGGLGLSDLV